nr:MAG TPA: hypothetical protein [Inoviridae sp.]
MVKIILGWFGKNFGIIFKWLFDAGVLKFVIFGHHGKNHSWLVW